MRHACKTDVQLLQKNITIKEWDALVRISGGDGRKLLNALEIIVNFKGGKQITITNKLVEDAVPKKASLCLIKVASSIMILFQH